MKQSDDEVPKGYKVIYTAFITLKNGKRIYAAQRGLKAFRLVVRDKKRR